MDTSRPLPEQLLPLHRALSRLEDLLDQHQALPPGTRGALESLRRELATLATEVVGKRLYFGAGAAGMTPEFSATADAIGEATQLASRLLPNDPRKGELARDVLLGARLGKAEIIDAGIEHYVAMRRAGAGEAA